MQGGGVQPIWTFLSPNFELKLSTSLCPKRDSFPHTPAHLRCHEHLCEEVVFLPGWTEEKGNLSLCLLKAKQATQIQINATSMDLLLVRLWTGAEHFLVHYIPGLGASSRAQHPCPAKLSAPCECLQLSGCQHAVQIMHVLQQKTLHHLDAASPLTRARGTQEYSGVLSLV